MSFDRISQLKYQEEEGTVNKIPDSKSNIEQIRDLIVGEHIQDYNRQINRLPKDLIDLQKTVADVSRTSEEHIEDLSKQVQLKLDKLERSLSSLKTELQQLQAQHKSLSAAFDEARAEQVNRMQLANLFAELALSLRGEDLLEKLADTNKRNGDDA